MSNKDEKSDLDLRGSGEALGGSGEQELSSGERAEASSLRDSLETGSVDAMASLLTAALRPGELDDAVHEQILAAALGLTVQSAVVPSSVALAAEAPADQKEQLAADALRAALDAQRVDHPLVTLAHALKNADAPRPIDDIKNEALLRPALKLPSRRNSRRVAFGATLGALALAAGFVGLYVSSPGLFSAPQAAPAAMVAPPPADLFVPGMVEVRSTTELFQAEDFPRTGGATRRIDRISTARQADLRQNRFAEWGLP